MIKYKHSDVFVNKMKNGKYMFGIILLDVKKQCFRKKIIDQSNSLSCYNGTVLIELFKEFSNTKNYSSSDVLIPGIFVFDFDLKDGYWEIIDNITVNPEKIDFPEGMLYSNGLLYFVKGEIKLRVPKPISYREEIGVGIATMACGSIEKIASFYLDNKFDSKDGPLYNYDLHFNDKRKKAYKLINENTKQSYSHMAKKYGFDLSRFY